MTTPKLSTPIPKPKPGWSKVTKDQVKEWLKTHKDRAAKLAHPKRAAKKAIRARAYRQSLPKGREITTTDPSQAWQVIYGRAQVGGQYTFRRAEAGKQEWHNFITFACHEIDAVEAVYLDDRRCEFGANGWATTAPFTNKVFLGVQLGTDAQTVQPDLNAAFPELWTADHRQRGHAGIYLKFLYDATVFAGDPDVSIQVRGRKLYDPRDASTVWKQNAALAGADYITNARFGLGNTFTWDDIDTSANYGGLQYAANACDQRVALKAGGDEARYEANGYFDVSNDPDTILAMIEDAMAGSIVYWGGLWRFLPGIAAPGPSITLTADDLRAMPRVTSISNRRNSFNSVRGTFTDAANNYQETDFPGVSVQAYVEADGGQTVWGDIDLPLVTSATQAQRIARIELERARRGFITEEAAFSLKAYPLQLGERVNRFDSEMGWSPKEFEVLNYELTESSEGEVRVELLNRAHDTGIYSWTPAIDEQAVHISPATNLPNPFTCKAPTNLTVQSGTAQLDLRSDGTVWTRALLSWTVPDDVYVKNGGLIELQYKKHADATWRDWPSVDGGLVSAYITDLQDGVAYDFRARSYNRFVRSSWVTVSNHTVLGKSAPPSDVTGLTATIADNKIVLSWNQISDVDRSHYVIKRGSSWATATVLHSDFRGTVFVWDTPPAAGTHTFLVKAVDTSAHESTNAARVSKTITAPGAVQALKGSPNENQACINWEKPASGTLPVQQYRIYKGDNFNASDLSGAELLGTVSGTYFQFAEQFGGVYSYHVMPEDSAGNLGAASSVTFRVFDPPGYFLDTDLAIDPAYAGATENCLISSQGTDLFDAQPASIAADLAPSLWIDPAYECYSGPVLHYKCEDNADNTTVTDAIGNHNGTASKNTSLLSTASGKLGRAFSFNGDRIDCGADFIGTKDVTFAAWVNVYVDGSRAILNNGMFQIWRNPDGVAVYDNPESSGWVGVSFHGAPGPWVWHHLVVTRSAGGSAAIYINGALVKSGLSGTPAAGTAHVIIGQDADGFNWFRGALDDIRIYDRIISGAEIQALYNHGAGVADSGLPAESKVYICKDLENAIADFRQADSAKRPEIGTQNDRPALFFQGAQNLRSAGTLADIWNADRGMIALAFSPTNPAAQQRIFGSLGGGIAIEIAVPGNQVYISYNDLNYFLGPIEAGKNYVLTVALDPATGVLAMNLYGEGGLIDTLEPIPGDLADLSGALAIGGTGFGLWYEGSIGSILTWDRYDEHELGIALQLLLARHVYPAERLSANEAAGSFVVPYTLGQTFDQVLTEYSATTFDDLIAAGITRWAQPVPVSGSWEYLHDCGQRVSYALVVWDYVREDFGVSAGGAPLVVPTISLSADGVTWTEYEGQLQVFAQNFRFVRLHIDIDGDGEHVFSLFKDMTLQLKVKKEKADGSATLAVDGSATQVSFGVTFTNLLSLTANLVNQSGFLVWTAVQDGDGNYVGMSVRGVDENGDALSAPTIMYSATGLLKLEG